ncbi:hypothetical protein GS429_12485 [Natronorubrum sp. JWXQ-INN-674]|uniref:Uncharacterized protein n=1 Tax=Natronorubrum halalkaliphilum TaxID=2691917 RepID=A0A6B0VN20_9EURY|nr:hypothetical protein [Natronorubrum halalkaliphilum]MXV62868.1 hypothetical protein [Natronorubrum halalkaliphilum]
MDDHQRLTELDEAETATLASEARQSEYYDRLESYLADEYDETVPSENSRAFERGDGARAVSFESTAGAGARPAVAVTFHFEGDSNAVAQATAERHGADVDGDVELLFPTEIAPKPEVAVRDILRPEVEEAEVTVDESGEITSYTVET